MSFSCLLSGLNNNSNNNATASFLMKTAYITRKATGKPGLKNAFIQFFFKLYSDLNKIVIFLVCLIIYLLLLTQIVPQTGLDRTDN